MIDWVKLGLDQFLEQNDPDRTGMMMMHACDYADMLQVMCMLSRSGHGDYWEDIDRWIRNGFDWRQITREDVDRMNNRPIMRMGDPKNDRHAKQSGLLGDGRAATQQELAAPSAA